MGLPELWQVRYLLAFIKVFFFCFTSTFYVSQLPKASQWVTLCHCPEGATFPAPILGCLLLRGCWQRPVASPHHMLAERWDACAPQDGTEGPSPRFSTPGELCSDCSTLVSLLGGKQWQQIIFASASQNWIFRTPNERGAELRFSELLCGVNAQES